MAIAMRGGAVSAFRPKPIALIIALSLPAIAAHAQTQTQTQTEASATSGQLSEVVVSAAGFEQDIKQAPASISVVTREQLESSRASTLAEALQDVEGVDVGMSTDKNGNPSISIRGMGPDYTLILIDGRRQNAAGSLGPNGFGNYGSAFLPPVSAIERIEVIRGPMSTLYGSDAMGGVVNIITRKVGKEWVGSVTVDRTFQEDSERGDIYSGNVYLSGPIKKDLLGLQIRASTKTREASDLDPTGIEVGEVEISKRGPSPQKAKTHTVGARLTLTPNKNHEIYVDADRATQIYDNSTGLLGTLGVQGYEKTLKFNREQVVLAHNGQFGFGRLETSLTRNKTENVGRTVPAADLRPGVVAGSPRTLETTNTILDTKLMTSLGESHFLSVGAQYWRAEMTDLVAPSDFKFNQWALFGEDEWRLTQNLALTLGGRYDHHSQFGSHFSPRAYAVWNATDTWTVKGGVSRGFKTPAINDLVDGINGFTRQGRQPTVGTPSLKPETSTSYELGTIYDSKQGFTAGATVFFNQFKDKITTGNSVSNCAVSNVPGCVDVGGYTDYATFDQKANVDKAETKGLELNTRIPILHNVHATANYTYLRSEDKATGNPLVNSPKHTVNAKLHWKINEKANTWLGMEYRSKRWRDDDDARALFGDYKASTVVNLGGSYRPTQSLTLNAAIYNLFDKDYLKYGVYRDGSTIVYNQLYNIHEEGRRLWLSATYTF